MSWNKNPYEDNPFAESYNDKTVDPRVPLKVSKPPEWLQDQNSPETFSNGGSYIAPISPDARPVSDQEILPTDSAIPRMILYTRVINLVLSVCMILASLLSLLTTDNATTGVLACYVVVFSCLICCFETHLKQISKIIAFNFGFMYSAKSRSVFMIFVGMCILFGKIIGVLMLANAGFNIFILLKYPEYDDAQRKDAQSEITDYLASNPAFAKQVVAIGVKATSDFVAQNPEIATQALFSAAKPPAPQQADV